MNRSLVMSPDGGYMFPNHKAQTQLYDLLIQSNFPNRQGYSNIAYTKAAPQEKPLRTAVVSTTSPYLDRQALLMLRNRIVANDFKLAEGDFSPLEVSRPRNLPPCRSIRRKM
ncbi:MAG: hypothetical protein IPJ00_19295 [Saprospirales bacterium]|nr:hypothetical protein [Saprospirales bacterium]